MQPAIRIANAALAVITRRDVLAPQQDLAVRSDPYLDAFNRLTDRAPARIERMVQRRNRGRLREPVALDHDIAQFAPEFLQRRIEWRSAHHEAPELPAQTPVYAPVLPPLPVPLPAACGRTGLGHGLQDVIPQQF